MILAIIDAAPHLRDATVWIHIPQTPGGADLRPQQEPHIPLMTHQAENLQRLRAAHPRLLSIPVGQLLWTREPLESLHPRPGHPTGNEIPIEVENTIVSVSGNDHRRAVGIVLQLLHEGIEKETSLLLPDRHRPTVTEKVTFQGHHQQVHRVEAILLLPSRLLQVPAQLYHRRFREQVTLF